MMPLVCLPSGACVDWLNVGLSFVVVLVVAFLLWRFVD